jgi:hypothetical protein
MVTTLHKKHLINLIADDLINWRLINELAKTDARAWRYVSKNIEAVIDAMHFEHPANVEQYEYYTKRRRDALQILLFERDRNLFKKLAEEIYIELERRMNHAE